MSDRLSHEVPEDLEGILVQLQNTLDWGTAPYPAVEYRMGTAPTQNDYGTSRRASKEEVGRAFLQARQGKGRMAYGYDTGLHEGRHYVRRFKVVVLPYTWYAEIKHTEEVSEEILREELQAAARKVRKHYPHYPTREVIDITLKLQKYEKLVLVEGATAAWRRVYFEDNMKAPVGASEMLDRWVSNEPELRTNAQRAWLVTLYLVFALSQDKISDLRWTKVQPPKNHIEVFYVAEAQPISPLEEIYWTLALEEK